MGMLDIKEHIQFINISSEDLNIIEWKPPRSFKSFILDLNILKEKKVDNIFFHINKGNMKIVHIRKNNLIYSIGSDHEIQYQILEAILEKVDELFHEIYDIDVILSYSNTTSAIFKNFKNEINNLLKNFKELQLVKKVDVFCRVCKATLPLYIKKSIIDEAASFPIPVVYNHKGHAIVTYIDRDFVVRGVEVVSMTG
jgi:hypothetical protein